MYHQNNHFLCLLISFLPVDSLNNDLINILLIICTSQHGAPCHIKCYCRAESTAVEPEQGNTGVGMLAAHCLSGMHCLVHPEGVSISPRSCPSDESYMSYVTG